MDKIIKSEILAKYPIEKNFNIKKFNKGLSGTAFLLKTTTHDYVLRLYKRKNKNIYNITKFINFLNLNHFPTNKLIANINNENISEIDDTKIVLMEYAKGNNIPWEKISKTTSKDIALYTSQLYKLGLIFYKKNKDFRNNLFINLEKIKKEYINESNVNSLYKVNLNKIRKSVIHSDISRENLLINSKKRISAIIDFDDAQENYLVWDYATLLTQVFVTKTYGIDWRAIKTFHHEFNKNFELNKDELRMIVPLMIYRNKMIYKEVSNNSSATNKKELASIKESVAFKIGLIKNNSDKLVKIFESL